MYGPLFCYILLLLTHVIRLEGSNSLRRESALCLLGFWGAGETSVERLCCAFQALLHKENMGLAGVISLALKLLINVLLFTEITFRLGCSDCCRRPRGLFLALHAIISRNRGGRPIYGGCKGLPTTVHRGFPSRIRSTALVSLFDHDSLCRRNRRGGSMVLTASQDRVFSALNIGMLSKGISRLSGVSTLFVSHSLTRDLFTSTSPVKGAMVVGVSCPLAIQNIFRSVPRGTRFQFSKICSFIAHTGEFESRHNK